VKRRLLALAIVILSLACSPEATRMRNGGPGADIGNYSPNLPERSTAPRVGD
jgi:hypothetical protein